MRIAQITPYAYPHIGGIEIHVKNLSDALRLKKNDVAVISSNSGDFILKSINIPYSPIPIKKKEVNADIYHAHIPSPFFAHAYSRERPLVVTYHNDVEIPERVSGIKIPERIAGFAEKVNFQFARKVLERADAIIATTRDYAVTSPLLREFFNKVHVIPNGIWVDDFEFTGEKDDFILYAGRIVDYKGLGILISALENTDIRLVVAGDGEDRAFFENLAEKKGVRAIFLGRVEYRRLVKLMGRAKALVLPSMTRLEAFGIVLLEAMASGTPVIAYNTPGVRYVAEHGGFVFKSIEELRDIILNLDANTVRKKGREGRRFAEMHDWNIIAERVLELYESLL